MKIKYDADADAMYILLREDKRDHTKQIEKDIIADFNKEGQVIGVEILFVKEKNPELLEKFQIENLIPA
ncbi:MAG TPA: DUF2283 domain-containing protein [Candidatus Nanoarchaeia archaeon]|nr:DUF2283 domain-containing protein [Candidatus Nanoarchaeia archaeon]